MVGGGVGGLCCAIDLASRGLPVRVFERGDHAGGKARQIHVGGRSIDAGPTVLTMPWVFDELFDQAGSDFRREVRLDRAEVLARHFWSDGRRLDLHRDRVASADAIGEAFGATEARGYRDFCAQADEIYGVAEEYFLRAQRMTFGGVVKRFGASGLTTLSRLDAHRTMWSAIRRRFRNPALRQLFGRYATYCGASPFEAPATFNLIAHVEAAGVYRVEGGIFGLVRGLERLAESLGVVIRCGAEVERIAIERGRAVGVDVAGTRHRASVVVFAGDVAAIGGGALGPEAARVVDETPADGRSLSAVTWTMVARPVGVPLLHHNVLFSDDYEAEFEQLIDRGRTPRAPTVYVCAQDRADGPAGSNEGDPERLLIIVNAPPTGDDPRRWNDDERASCTKAMNRILQRAGLELVPEATEQTTPREFHRLFPRTGGALYGPRPKGPLSVLARAGAATKIPGLYLAGGSVHPGAGVPMAALSGRLAGEKIAEDFGSIARSRTVATTGTTSTA